MFLVPFYFLGFFTLKFVAMFFGFDKGQSLSGYGLCHFNKRVVLCDENEEHGSHFSDSFLFT